MGKSVTRRRRTPSALALATLAFAVAAALALTGCGGAKSVSNAGSASGTAPASSSAPGSPALTPTGAPAENSLTSADGGAISLPTPEGAQVKVVFPRGALAHDAVVSATALGGGKESGAVVGGFSLEEKGTGAGPKLASPALIYFVLPKGENASGASIVSYNADGSFAPVRTTGGTANGRVVLVAQVAHFSAYGVRQVEPQAAKQQNMPSPLGYNWVIYVKDSAMAEKNGMKSKLALDMKAVNTVGDIGGTYSATAKGSAGNVWSGKGGGLNETFDVKVSDFKFVLNPYFEMVPLTEEKDDGSLAPLNTDVDYQGYGTMTLTTTGKGTGTAMGVSVPVPVKPKTSKAKFTISVFGPELRMTVIDSTGATYYLDGYVRGEGK